MNPVEAELNAAAALAGTCIDNAEEFLASADYERALKCLYLGGTVFGFQSRELVSVRMEAALQRVAKGLPTFQTVPVEGRSQAVFLHVFTVAFAVGGQTAMAVRWMQTDPDSCHHVAILSRDCPVPEVIQQTVANSNGSVHIVGESMTLLEKAIWLRQLAYSTATYVVLHIEVADVICAAAFGIDGGPPILLVNHAAHIYWTGASVLDMTLNCRGSAYEQEWSRVHRGIARSATITIPLIDRGQMDRSPNDARRQAARKSLGIGADEFVILTVGAAFKYFEIQNLDFLEVCAGLLARLPGAVLLAAGPENDARWQAAAQRVGGRIRALGMVSQADLPNVHAATDVYIEGFPFGSTTALLEAAMCGIPVVLAPAECPPPFATDGIALDDLLIRPDSTEAYCAQVIALHNDLELRRERGGAVRTSVLKHHTGDGWRDYLKQTLARLPDSHRIAPAIQPKFTPPSAYLYWAEFQNRWTSCYEGLLERTIARALAWDVRLRLTASLTSPASRAELSSSRIASTPVPILKLLCNGILRVVPVKAGLLLFRGATFLFQRSIGRRLMRKLRGLIGKSSDSNSAYDQYRKSRDR